MSFCNKESVTKCIANLRVGKNQSLAQHTIWQRYFFRLAALADQKLQCVPVVDGEDIAVSVLHSFFTHPDRYDAVNDSESLWPLLAKIATRKSISAFRKHIAGKRGGGNVVSESHVKVTGKRGSPQSLDEFVASDLTPEFADETFAQIRDLLELLESRDSSLHHIAILKLRGHTTREIASELGCVRRTVERKINVIQEIWNREQDDEDG